jgi:hypothetical protein
MPKGISRIRASCFKTGGRESIPDCEPFHTCSKWQIGESCASAPRHPKLTATQMPLVECNDLAQHSSLVQVIHRPIDLGKRYMPADELLDRQLAHLIHLHVSGDVNARNV